MSKLELVLNRNCHDSYASGALSINGIYECRTLEGALGVRVKAGKYALKFRKVVSEKTQKYRDNYSEFFSWHIELQDVAGRTFIYIHIGNSVKDTLGCVLVGGHLVVDKLRGSTDAYTKLYTKLCAALMREDEVTIEIFD